MTIFALASKSSSVQIFFLLVTWCLFVCLFVFHSKDQLPLELTPQLLVKAMSHWPGSDALFWKYDKGPKLHFGAWDLASYLLVCFKVHWWSVGNHHWNQKYWRDFPVLSWRWKVEWPDHQIMKEQWNFAKLSLNFSEAEEVTKEYRFLLLERK